MPFFKGATDFEIHDSTFNDVKGDYTANNTTTNRNLTNSNNKRVKTVENSYNDGSVEWSNGDGYERMAARPSGRALARRAGQGSADHRPFVPSGRSNTGYISRSPDRPLNLPQPPLHLSEGSESMSTPSGGMHSGRTRTRDGVSVARADPYLDSSDEDSTSGSATSSDDEDTEYIPETAATGAATAQVASAEHQSPTPQTEESEATVEYTPSASPPPPIIASQTSESPPPQPIPIQPTAHHRLDDEDGIEAAAVKDEIDDHHEPASTAATQVPPAPEIPKPAPTNTNVKPEKKSKIKSFFHLKRPSFRRDSH
ncbi:hypothetical protein EYR40_002089 [Pleurotus pulmonarius]|nr:hypothetical protein EYR36_011510 [Pleurotus pulmonarius]KAF4585252.1 hypothetical protein EYR40_002089 [Pleurotus pulmonarius]